MENTQPVPNFAPRVDAAALPQPNTNYQPHAHNNQNYDPQNYYYNNQAPRGRWRSNRGGHHNQGRKRNFNNYNNSQQYHNSNYRPQKYQRTNFNQRAPFNSDGSSSNPNYPFYKPSFVQDPWKHLEQGLPGREHEENDVNNGEERSTENNPEEIQLELDEIIAPRETSTKGPLDNTSAENPEEIQLDL